MTKVRCSSCNGKGEVPSGHATLYGTLAYRVCDSCLGLGFDYHYNCEACMDTGLEDVVDGQPWPCPVCSGMTTDPGDDPDRAAYAAHLDRMADLDIMVEEQALAEEAVA